MIKFFFQVCIKKKILKEKKEKKNEQKDVLYFIVKYDYSLKYLLFSTINMMMLCHDIKLQVAIYMYKCTRFRQCPKMSLII